jgi:hypothetical protein
MRWRIKKEKNSADFRGARGAVDLPARFSSFRLGFGDGLYQPVAEFGGVVA